MPNLPPNEARFVAGVAAQTGLDPRVVAAWVIAEEGYRNVPVGHNDHNFLNIGNTDTKWYGSSVWATSDSAISHTAAWIKGTYSVPGFGRAAPGIRRIVQTAGQPADKQIAAIANSGWASSGYNGGADLRRIYNDLRGIKLPGASAADAVAGVTGTGQADTSGGGLNLNDLLAPLFQSWTKAMVWIALIIGGAGLTYLGFTRAAGASGNPA